MRAPSRARPEPRLGRLPRDPLRSHAEQAFSRAAGAPLVAGNAVRLLRDAGENYPAWLSAIRGARTSVLFENYILADDEVGRTFVAALRAKVGEGVTVRVLYDWLGSLGERTGRLLAPLAQAGAEVRCFNPPRIDSPLGWLRRDHRKSLVIDAEVGFVTGLCVAKRWAGDPARGRAPWRDTGVEVRGPAVADLARAFAQVWDEAGAPIPDAELPVGSALARAGPVQVRVVATAPSTTGIYRLDHLIAALARRTLWLTDAYFVGTPSYVQALCAAALDGVDVRLLVPGDTDVFWLKPLTRSGYRPLLEAGVRVFEWNGPMLHAKTAVADGRWARVGSSNLNVASWMGNHELDLAIEDEDFAHRMEETYLEDLSGSTEIVLGARRRRRSRARTLRQRLPSHGERRASSGLAAAGALRLGHAVGAALGGQRLLAPTEASLVATAALAVLALSALTLVFPRLAAVPLGLVGLWIGTALALKALRLRAQARARSREIGPAAVPRQGAASDAISPQPGPAPPPAGGSEVPPGPLEEREVARSPGRS
jgi:cardiolipin synthase